MTETYLSTLLFNIVLEAIERRAKLQTTGTIFNKQTQRLTLTYADEFISLALEVEAAKVGKKIHEKKTKYMFAVENRMILDDRQTVAFSDKNFEVVNEFAYFRALVTPKNDVGLKIQRRIQTANRCKLQTAKTSAVISPGTSDKVNDMAVKRIC
jgi:hypothetical protein